MASPALDLLPPELYIKILEQVPSESLQQTVLALTRACPYSPIPLYHLFQNIRLTRANQVVRLYQRLRRPSGDAAISCIREFSLETWTVDADVVLNLVQLLHTGRVTALSLFIGPYFAPEHLVEMFDKPMVHLKYLSIRFRPYVQRATYYQFLKGAYFDSALLALSQWPPTSLPMLSIIQDPLDPDFIHTQAFAQPLVFFRLDPFATLACSPYLQGLVFLRLRIPSRHLPHFIVALPGSLPSLQLLDLSTCTILATELATILMRFPKLRHVILDGCALALERMDSMETQRAIGKMCALAGVRRAKEREAKLKNWLESQAILEHPGASDAGASQGTDVQRPGRPAKKGRKGLATATVSLRASPPKTAVSLPAVILSPKVKRAVIHILPPSPTLASLCMTTLTHVNPERRQEIITEFEKGWADGLIQLSSIRRRYQQWWRNGVRIVRFREDGNADGEGLDGLVDLEGNDEEYFRAVDGGDGEVCSPPVLCLSGSARDETHAVGCGHAVGRSVWKDQL